LNHAKAFARFLVLSQDTAAVCNTATGVSEVEPAQRSALQPIQIWPNPLRGGLLNIELLLPAQELHLELYASDGKLLSSKAMANEQLIQWNLEGLPAGLYWLRWTMGAERGFVKLIKP
jgi:hypothetical protein